MIPLQSQPFNIRQTVRWVAYLLSISMVFIISLFVLLDRILPSPVPVELAYSVQVLDRDEQLLRLFTTDGGFWRIQADISDVDPVFIKQLLAYEDKRFWSHQGVDPLATIRAAYQYIVHGRIISGASTITMQTVRLLKPRQRTVWNKLIEMAEAFRLEHRLEKEEILNLYLSLTPYGGNLQGIETASLFYFNKNASRLNPSEAALLISLPQSPESRRPDRHPQKATEARLAVLNRLASENLLSDEDVILANKRPVPNKRYRASFQAPHLADQLRVQYPKKNILITTLDSSLQKQLTAIADRVQIHLEKGATLAALVVDNRSNQVLAHIGSGDFFKSSQLDLTRAVRSPGSTLKPFIYGLGFEQKLIHPETKILDRTQRFGDYHPENFDGTYRGWISVRQALHQSLNIPAVQVLDKVGPFRLISRFEDVGVSLQYRERPGLSLALGGVGCTLENLVALYSALANNGEYQSLRYMQNETPQAKRPLLSPMATWYLDDILQTMPFSTQVTGNQNIRFKTGTSYGFRDAWGIGYTPDYTIGVWVGRPDGGYGKSGTGSSLAVPVMLEMFSALPEHKTKTKKSIPPSEVLVSRHNELPPALKWFGNIETDGSLQNNQPRITFPVNGSSMPLRKDSTGRPLLVLKADGGVPPLHWMVDGKLLDTVQNATVAQYYPNGPGMTRITLIDGNGKRDQVGVWLEME